MTPIKEQFAALAIDLDKASKEVPKVQIIAKCMQLAADLQDDATEVSADDFGALTSGGRKMAAMGLTVLMLHAVQS